MPAALKYPNFYGEDATKGLFQEHFYHDGEKIESSDNDYADTAPVQPLLVGKDHLIPVGMFYDMA
jgi:hypothetical protein